MLLVRTSKPGEPHGVRPETAQHDVLHACRLEDHSLCRDGAKVRFGQIRRQCLPSSRMFVWKRPSALAGSVQASDSPHLFQVEKAEHDGDNPTRTR